MHQYDGVWKEGCRERKVMASIVDKCLVTNPNTRPTFKEMVEFFDSIMPAQDK